jgi:hypothetical protein
MKFGAIIIGDEILSGKRQDGTWRRRRVDGRARELELGWCHYRTIRI